jgi:hypothetical protein
VGIASFVGKGSVVIVVDAEACLSTMARALSVCILRLASVPV